MTREEAREFLINISYKLGNMSVEYLSEKDGEKMREAIKALDQEPVIDNTEQCMKAMKATDRLQRWIPVSERLPKAGEYVEGVAKYYLVQNEYEDMLVARYTHSGYWVQIYQLEPIEDEIVAWMPLPQPYKAESEEEDERFNQQTGGD